MDVVIPYPSLCVLYTFFYQLFTTVYNTKSLHLQDNPSQNILRPAYKFIELTIL